MEFPEEVGSDEKIGRALSRSNPDKAKDEANVRESLIYSFREHKKLEISVNRVSLARQHGKIGHIESLAEKLEPDPNRPFQGWAKFLTSDVLRIGLCVAWSPIRGRTNGTNNEYHADILLPPYATELEDVEEFVQDLLLVRRWCPRQSPQT